MQRYIKPKNNNVQHYSYCRHPERSDSEVEGSRRSRIYYIFYASLDFSTALEMTYKVGCYLKVLRKKIKTELREHDLSASYPQSTGKRKEEKEADFPSFFREMEKMKNEKLRFFR